MHSLLHCHFESGLRALAVARPAQMERLRPVFEIPAYQRADPARRLRLLDEHVTCLTEHRSLFTPGVFAEVVRRLSAEMTRSGIAHADLRIGVVMRRWPFLGSVADIVGAFRAALPPDAPGFSFLGAVSLSKPPGELDTVVGRVLDDACGAGLLAGVDLTLAPSDLPALDRHLGALRDLQRSGRHVNVHLGELFGAGFSRRVLARIVPNRIGHGVRLLDDPETVAILREHGTCLDMCPVSNTLLGVWDWAASSPAAHAMRLGLPVTVNTDDPVLFGAGLAENLALAGLSPVQLEIARQTGNRHRSRQ
jgi:adenosine deaminase